MAILSGQIDSLYGRIGTGTFQDGQERQDIFAEKSFKKRIQNHQDEWIVIPDAHPAIVFNPCKMEKGNYFSCSPAKSYSTRLLGTVSIH
ncbi:hypothetical protein [Brevibacillus marinus]|uniref:hypothetical protein n=1 Tax=Brevibacillus marinus TaxID=2496837 RepID=UPI000F84CC0C|nr:hypothetical protein [Brevibacillus marinus]